MQVDKDYRLYGALTQAGRFDDAIAGYRSVLTQQESAGDTAASLRTSRFLAHTLARAGRVDDADDAYSDAVAGYTRVLGAEHPGTLDARRDHLVSLRRSGRQHEALPA